MTWPTFLSHNPVAWVAFLNGVVDLAIAFGGPISDPEKVAIGVVLGLGSTLFVQAQVTSTAKLASMGVRVSHVIEAQPTATIVRIADPVPPAPPPAVLPAGNPTGVFTTPGVVPPPA